MDSDSLWKRLILKDGEEDLGWSTREARWPLGWFMEGNLKRVKLG